MSIAYVAASSEHHTNGSAGDMAPSGYPFTVSAWFDLNNATTGQVALSGYETDGSSNYYNLSMSSGNVNHQVGDSVLATKSGVTADTWHHACGVSATQTSHQAFLDGAAGTEDTTNAGFSVDVLDRCTLGSQNRAATNAYFDGEIAHCAVWSVALSPGEISALASGAHPFSIRPGSLVHYWPLRGDGPVGTRVRDSTGAVHLETVSGTPAKAESRPNVRNTFLQGVG